MMSHISSNWEPLITNRIERNRIKEKIDEIYLNVNNSIKNSKGFSLYFEAGGLLLFLAYYQMIYGEYKQKKSDSVNLIAKSLIDRACLCKVERLSDISRFSELGILINHLHQKGCLSGSIHDICKDMDNVLINVVPRLADCYLFDLMSGIVSIGLYYCQRYNNDSHRFKPHLEKIVDVLYERAIFNDNLVMWPSIVDNEEQQIGFNFGLAHGIPGIILFLFKILRLNISEEKTTELIIKSTKFLLTQMHSTEEHISYFYDISDINCVGEDSRLSWCYGDLGIAYAFFLLSMHRKFDSLNLDIIALQILRDTTLRLSYEKTRVRDAGLCHGCFGIAHMYNRLYQMVGKRFLMDASLYWYRKGFEMCCDSSSTYNGFLLPFFNSSDDPEIVHSYNLSFQTGISGIALSMISSIENTIPDWDFILLLS